MSQLILNKAEDIEVFLDPFHMKIMRTMKSMHKPMTVKEIGNKMDEVPAKVYYHVKKLEAIGVLYVKYTEQINGIVAKYYDFTTDRVALSVPNCDQDKDVLCSQMMREYGRCFDDAKQQFYDLFNNSDDGSIDSEDAFIFEKDPFPIDPRQIDKLNDDIEKLFEKYRFSGKDAVKYSIFIAGMRNFDNKTDI